MVMMVKIVMVDQISIWVVSFNTNFFNLLSHPSIHLYHLIPLLCSCLTLFFEIDDEDFRLSTLEELTFHILRNDLCDTVYAFMVRDHSQGRDSGDVHEHYERAVEHFWMCGLPLPILCRCTGNTLHGICSRHTSHLDHALHTALLSVNHELDSTGHTFPHATLEEIRDHFDTLLFDPYSQRGDRLRDFLLRHIYQRMMRFREH